MKWLWDALHFFAMSFPLSLTNILSTISTVGRDVSFWKVSWQTCKWSYYRDHWFLWLMSRRTRKQRLFLNGLKWVGSLRKEPVIFFSFVAESDPRVLVSKLYPVFEVKFVSLWEKRSLAHIALDKKDINPRDVKGAKERYSFCFHTRFECFMAFFRTTNPGVVVIFVVGF